GNLEDITLRALRLLREVDVIACEDTRQTMKLLSHYEIRKPLVSFYTYNQRQRMPHIVADIMAGKNYALVTDSGTPGISDPGHYLVEAILEAGISVVPLPGPCAAITALVASGLASDDFVFLGFLKRKAGKLKKELTAAAALGSTVVFYESPHRVCKTLTHCAAIFPPQTRVVLAREITKKFEEFIRGTLSSVLEVVKGREMRGEFVIMIAPERVAKEDDDKEEQRDEKED
ncbi:MAG: 16S rRNA (cytidine(1402)-2'-O)-methyltransferase, partial [Endomicrobiales bacterium]